MIRNNQQCSMSIHSLHRDRLNGCGVPDSIEPVCWRESSAARTLIALFYKWLCMFGFFLSSLRLQVCFSMCCWTHVVRRTNDLCLCSRNARTQACQAGRPGRVCAICHATFATIWPRWWWQDVRTANSAADVAQSVQNAC